MILLNSMKIFNKLFCVFQSRFRDPQQLRLFGMLCFATAMVAALVLIRLFLKRENLPEISTWQEFLWSRGMTYAFLLWNLFLAWVPYLAALRFERAWRRGRPRVFLGLWFCLWLAFLPNAPYIITDLKHLRPLEPIPYWFDAALLFSAACTGLLLGLLSLYEVHRVFLRWFSAGFAWSLVVMTVGLSGFGVWLGRFQRWNSWDVVTRPDALFSDILRSLSQPQTLLHIAGVTVLLSGIMLTGYGLLRAMMPVEGQMSE
jgi:uncharacterized membrane protein